MSVHEQQAAVSHRSTLKATPDRTGIDIEGPASGRLT
jgi:hypothetical protein